MYAVAKVFCVLESQKCPCSLPH